MSSDTPWGIFAVVGLLLFGAHQCSQTRQQEDGIAFASKPVNEDQALDRATDAAADAVAGTTYQDQGRPYGCTEDCSGHDAGYEWADANEVTDPGDCGGNSSSFGEGCEAYAEAYQEARREALEDEGLEEED